MVIKTFFMENVVLVIHLFLALGIIGLVLLQRSEGGALGIGGGSGGMGSLASASSTKNLLTKMTSILAGCFFLTSLLLAILAGTHNQSSIIDDLDSVPAILDSAAETGDNEIPEADSSEGKTSPVPSAPISE